MGTRGCSAARAPRREICAHVHRKLDDDVRRHVRQSWMLFAADEMARLLEGKDHASLLRYEEGVASTEQREKGYWRGAPAGTAATRGIVNENVLPAPTVLSTWIWPPCASTASLQKARPRPVPT